MGKVQDPFAFLLDSGLSVEDIQKFLRDKIPLDEVAQSVKGMLARGEAITGDDRLLTTEDKPTPTLSIVSAVSLQQKDIPPIRWIVQNLIPAGMSILASPPKFGKSWMAMHLCLSVAMGGSFLGFQCCKAGCLYMALEDGERRLKGRMEKILYPIPAPQGFDFTTMAPTLGNGLVDALEEYIKLHPDTGLIVLDTLQKIRDVGGGRNVYGQDYADLSQLKKFADTHNVALFIIHHLRKMADDSDPFNRISGSNGISGAADTMMVLERKRRTDDTATLSITGRDVEMQELVLQFDKNSCLWKNMGDLETYTAQQAKAEYDGNPIAQTARGLLEESPNGEWIGSSTQLLDAGEHLTGRKLADSGKGLTKKLREMTDLLFDDGIYYERRENGTGGGKHFFTYAK